VTRFSITLAPEPLIASHNHDAVYKEVDLHESLSANTTINWLLSSHSGSELDPTLEDLLGPEELTFGIDELLAIHDLCHGDSLTIDNIPMDELELYSHLFQTADASHITSEEHALGSFTCCKLKGLPTWPLWLAGFRVRPILGPQNV
jgi:hypothetical protein